MQERFVFGIAEAVVRLWIAGTVRSSPDVHIRAADTLRRSRPEVLAAHDRELVGAWAMGGAELAASRGETEPARELWALATRVGVNVGRFFPQGRGERLAAALGGQDGREPLLAETARLRGTVAHRRITALMDALLA